MPCKGVSSVRVDESAPIASAKRARNRSSVIHARPSHHNSGGVFAQEVTVPNRLRKYTLRYNLRQYRTVLCLAILGTFALPLNLDKTRLSLDFCWIYPLRRRGNRDRSTHSGQSALQE